MKIGRVFVAGTIQGANQGTKTEDQGYRTSIPLLVKSHFPDATFFDPSRDVARELGDPQMVALVQSLLRDAPAVMATDVLPDRVRELRSTFHAMTREVTQCDLCIAYLPGRSLSMGTAMEMYAAWSGGVPVVAITEMLENLAILSVSDWVVRDMESLGSWLSDLRLDEVQ